MRKAIIRLALAAAMTLMYAEAVLASMPKRY